MTNNLPSACGRAGYSLSWRKNANLLLLLQSLHAIPSACSAFMQSWCPQGTIFSLFAFRLVSKRAETRMQSSRMPTARKPHVSSELCVSQSLESCDKICAERTASPERLQFCLNSVYCSIRDSYLTFWPLYSILQILSWLSFFIFLSSLDLLSISQALLMFLV